MLNQLLEYLLLFLLSFTWAGVWFQPETLVLPVVLVVVIQGFFLYLGDSHVLGILLLLIFAGLCMAVPLLVVFLPLVLYGSLETRKLPWALPSLAASAAAYPALGPQGLVLTGVVCTAALVLYLRSRELTRLGRRYYNLRDESKLLHARLESRQRQLLERQDAEIHLATLNERTRIARDIHDNVGHLLSRALLQVAALRTYNPAAPPDSPPEICRQTLDQLQDTLNQGMTSIRSSVHQLHAQAIDVKHHLEKLLGEVTHCSCEYSIDLYTEPDKDTAYAIIAMVKEALANLMKHSRARIFILRFREHPGFYQLVMENDGVEYGSPTPSNHGRISLPGLQHTPSRGARVPEGAGTSRGSRAQGGAETSRGAGESQDFLGTLLGRTGGLGLQNMHDRVEALGGRMQISRGMGFRIFITLPKPTKGANP